MVPVSRAVHGKSDVEFLRRESSAMVKANGGSNIIAVEAAIIVSELGTNLLRHAHDGVISLSIDVAEDQSLNFRVESCDEGPGIDDIDRAFVSGYTTRGGLGEGLSAIRRLSDSVTVKSSPSGTHLVATKSLKVRP